ncbi:MAG: hypothetical protein JJ992_28110 [Planctomycetes bacterium]|nr:hypothetical protein [Planctomycetota bacterium]
MSSEHAEVFDQPERPFTQEVTDPPRHRGRNACLIGCLVIFLICLIACSGIAWYVYANLGPLKTAMADMARESIVSGIRESKLEEKEKQAIIAQVDRVVDKYKSGEITTQQLQRVMQELAESPLMGAILLYSVETQYVQPSGLSDEEKQQARRTLQRVLRGVTEGKIKTEQLDSAMDYVTVKQGKSRQFKKKISDGDLRAFLAELKRKADDADVPDEPFEIKASEEFRKAIDRALGEGPAPRVPEPSLPERETRRPSGHPFQRVV